MPMAKCFGVLQGFWRNWHASFNLWLVRYMYVPLGGGAWRGANVWPIFTFVALWHDLEWRLLAWAWLSSLLFAPELVRKRVQQKVRAANNSVNAAACFVSNTYRCRSKESHGGRLKARLMGATVMLLIALELVQLCNIQCLHTDTAVGTLLVACLRS